jgi:hypothetical protein
MQSSRKHVAFVELAEVELSFAPTVSASDEQGNRIDDASRVGPSALSGRISLADDVGRAEELNESASRTFEARNGKRESGQV